MPASCALTTQPPISPPLQDPNLPSLGPVARNQVYRQMAASLSRLHSVNPSAAGLDSFGSASNYCARQVIRDEARVAVVRGIKRVGGQDRKCRQVGIG